MPFAASPRILIPCRVVSTKVGRHPPIVPVPVAAQTRYLLHEHTTTPPLIQTCSAEDAPASAIQLAEAAMTAAAAEKEWAVVAVLARAELWSSNVECQIMSNLRGHLSGFPPSNLKDTFAQLIKEREQSALGESLSVHEQETLASARESR